MILIKKPVASWEENGDGLTQQYFSGSERIDRFAYNQQAPDWLQTALCTVRLSVSPCVFDSVCHNSVSSVIRPQKIPSNQWNRTAARAAKPTETGTATIKHVSTIRVSLSVNMDK
ncbi:MAG: hypothetical protein EOQ50_24235 [Mesorhizobium sp.]|uniref:hypothetical protein n=1 Tax=Mesorhizobium sp. TaxID=1871066 RepID=UPI000FE85400|nr:hypothetical protein [Mesorhizobium sp.]RWB70421.1 MAG: hypothetical protein EOQ50_24235 [Mesorhizobium sp.]